MSLAHERLKKRSREARIERSAAFERLVQELVHSKEKRRLLRPLSFRALAVSERRPGRLAHALALLGIAYPKQLHETDRLVETEPGGAQGECRRDLLLLGELRDALGDGGAKETIAEELWNLGVEPLEDL